MEQRDKVSKQAGRMGGEGYDELIEDKCTNELSRWRGGGEV